MAGTALVHNTYNIVHTNQFLLLVDIDECHTNTSGCEQICTNQVPFFSCSCTSGYRLYNEKFCSGKVLYDWLAMILSFMTIDIDECSEGVSGCSQLCTNTIGSYTCTCRNGYQLGNDNHTCTDIDECSVNNNGGCEQTCSNTNGSYYCSCLTGYSLDDNDHNCTGKLLKMCNC